MQTQSVHSAAIMHILTGTAEETVFFISVNACSRDTFRCSVIVWLQEAVLTSGWKGKKNLIVVVKG